MRPENASSSPPGPVQSLETRAGEEQGGGDGESHAGRGDGGGGRVVQHLTTGSDERTCVRGARIGVCN